MEREYQKTGKYTINGKDDSGKRFKNQAGTSYRWLYKSVSAWYSDGKKTQKNAFKK